MAAGPPLLRRGEYIDSTRRRCVCTLYLPGVLAANTVETLSGNRLRRGPVPCGSPCELGALAPAVVDNSIGNRVRPTPSASGSPALSTHPKIMPAPPSSPLSPVSPCPGRMTCSLSSRHLHRPPPPPASTSFTHPCARFREDFPFPHTRRLFLPSSFRIDASLTTLQGGAGKVHECQFFLLPPAPLIFFCFVLSRPRLRYPFPSGRFSTSLCVASFASTTTTCFLSIPIHRVLFRPRRSAAIPSFPLPPILPSLAHHE